MSTFAKIANLAEANAWTAGATWAKVRFEFNVSDPDGDSITQVNLKVYSASAGGTTLASIALTGAALATALANGYYDSTWRATLGTEYWWTIEAIDSLGESSGESSRTAFKVKWGQAIYEYAVPGGATTSAWSFSHSALPANTEAAFLFRTATGAGGAGASAWTTNISDLTPSAYLNVMVRLATYLAGTQPTLDDMTFSYSGAATIPDHWAVDDVTKWSLEGGKFRYGTKSFKGIAATNSAIRQCYPYRVLSGDDIPCQPDTDYTLTAFVNTGGMPLASGGVLFLGVAQNGGFGVIGSTSPDDQGNYGATSDSSLYSEGWQRLQLHFHTGTGVTSLRPFLKYQGGGGGASDQWWTDAWRLEEGLVASPYTPSFISEAGLWDSYGAMFDGTQGMTLRLKDTSGNIADLDDVVAAALGGGGGAGAGNLDGGLYNSTYGGTTALDGGAP